MQKSLFTLWAQRQAVGHLAVDRPKTSQSAISCDTISRIKSRRTICICNWPNDSIHCVTTLYGQGTHIVGHWPDTWWFLCTELFPRHLHKQVCFAFTMVEAFCDNGTQEEGPWAHMKFTFELLAGVRELNWKLAEIFGRNNTSRDFYRFPVIWQRKL